MTTEPNHLEKIRERFTATAEVFAETARTMRVEEGERLAELAAAALRAFPKRLLLTLRAVPARSPGLLLPAFAVPSAWI